MGPSGVHRVTCCCGCSALANDSASAVLPLLSPYSPRGRLPLLPSPPPPAQVLILDNNNSMRRDEEGVPWFDLPELTYLSLSSCPNLMGYALALYQLVGLQRLGAADNGTAPVGSSLDGCSALKVILGGGVCDCIDPHDCLDAPAKEVAR